MAASCDDSRWRLLADPQIPIDNDVTEQELRSPVVGRKNHDGSHSVRGTEVAALFYTLTEPATRGRPAGLPAAGDAGPAVGARDTDAAQRSAGLGQRGATWPPGFLAAHESRTTPSPSRRGAASGHACCDHPSLIRASPRNTSITTNSLSRSLAIDLPPPLRRLLEAYRPAPAVRESRCPLHHRVAWFSPAPDTREPVPNSRIPSLP